MHDSICQTDRASCKGQEQRFIIPKTHNRFYKFEIKHAIVIAATICSGKYGWVDYVNDKTRERKKFGKQNEEYFYYKQTGLII